MIQGIRENLKRQERGLDLLERLLEEEFSHLTARNPQAVGGVQFSIQELLRQLAVEREDLGALVRAAGDAGGRLTTLAETLAGEEKVELLAALERISDAERSCAARAALNAEIAIGLAGQSREMIAFLQAEILPKSKTTYSRAGKWRTPDAGPTVVRGRL